MVQKTGSADGAETKEIVQHHMELPILDSNLQPSDHKYNALPTELPGLSDKKISTLYKRDMIVQNI